MKRYPFTYFYVNPKSRNEKIRFRRRGGGHMYIFDQNIIIIKAKFGSLNNLFSINFPNEIKKENAFSTHFIWQLRFVAIEQK